MYDVHECKREDTYQINTLIHTKKIRLLELDFTIVLQFRKNALQKAVDTKVTNYSVMLGVIGSKSDDDDDADSSLSADPMRGLLLACEVMMALFRGTKLYASSQWTDGAEDLIDEEEAEVSHLSLMFM
eukprot:scaffold22001_cov151-Skeletonema_dohrnii-CCMP3373.AAC.17